MAKRKEIKLMRFWALKHVNANHPTRSGIYETRKAADKAYEMIPKHAKKEYEIVLLAAMPPKRMLEKVTKVERERDIKDLYYLDELIADLEENGRSFGAINTGGYVFGIFLREWYQELSRKVGHTREERLAYLNETFGEEWVADGHFLSEEQLNELLG